MEDAKRMIRTKWLDIRGPLSNLLNGPELHYAGVHALCTEYNVDYKARPDHHHNKMGLIKSTHSSIRLFVLRLLKDDDQFRASRP